MKHLFDFLSESDQEGLRKLVLLLDMPIPFLIQSSVMEQGYWWFSLGLIQIDFQLLPKTIYYLSGQILLPFTVVHWRKRLQECLADSNILKYISWEGKFLDSKVLGSSHLLLSPLFTPVPFCSMGFSFVFFLSVLIAAPICGLWEHSSRFICCGLDLDKLGWHSVFQGFSTLLEN